jgi:glyoxylase-like metal-dependent hydrolase (beta-lactamase superfamily II)
MATDFNEERLNRMEGVFPHIREGIKEGGFLEPTKWVETNYEYKGIVFNVHGGHSACSSSVYIPEENCVALGDLVQSERPPYFGEPDTDINSWVGALDSWEGSGITNVLPGHGPSVERDYLRGVSGYFKDLTESLRSLKTENISEEEVHFNESLPLGYWPKDSPKNPAHYYSIRQLYSSL